jgi:putative transposase
MRRAGRPQEEEFDDEEEPVYRAADHRDPVGAGTGSLATAKVCRRHCIGNATFFKWKSRFGGMDVSDASCLKVLEDENAKLEKLLAEAMLDVAMLKDLNGRNSDTRCEA